MAKDRIRLDTLVALRRVSGMEDTELLDVIEAEVRRRKERRSRDH